MRATVRLACIAAAGAAVAAALPAMAAPLLLIDGDDTSVLVLDMGSRQRSGDLRRVNIYAGTIALAGRAREVAGARYEFDCPGRRERKVATLSPRPGMAPLETPVEAPWMPIAWKTPMDYAGVAVCLEIYNRDRISTKTDVPSILDALDKVWQPGAYQPPVQPQAEPRRKRSLWRPF